MKLNPFTDGRKIPEVSINVKVKVDTETSEENTNWNRAFGYLMRKPRTKLEFINVTDIRKVDLSEVTLDKLKPYLQEEDYKRMKPIERLFDEKLTQDVKAFILSILKITPSIAESLGKSL